MAFISPFIIRRPCRSGNDACRGFGKAAYSALGYAYSAGRAGGARGAARVVVLGVLRRRGMCRSSAAVLGKNVAGGQFQVLGQDQGGGLVFHGRLLAAGPAALRVRGTGQMAG